MSLAFTYNTFEAIGTTWNIGFPTETKPELQKSVIEKIKERIAIFDKHYSRFRDDSLVSSIATKAGTYTMPDDADKMMNLYKEMYIATNGLMTPLIGSVLVDTGYDSHYSLKPKNVILKAPRWEDVIEYDHPKLVMKSPALLDFGGIGKGYLIDIVSEILTQNGIVDHVVDAGGDITFKTYSKDTKDDLRVGLENPTNQKQAVGVATIHNQSICGSAGNRRMWDKYHHIINPETTESPRHILGLWTIASSTLLADALSTALFFVRPEHLAKTYTFEYAILYADGTASTSKGFPGGFFTT